MLGPRLLPKLCGFACALFIAQAHAQSDDPARCAPDGAPRESIDTCTRLIDAARGDDGRAGEQLPAWYFNRALAYSRTGEDERAVADFDMVLRANPVFAPAYDARALAQHRLGRLEAAIADYNAALRLNDSDAFAYLNRGAAHADRGDYARAIEDYNDALRLTPNDPYVFNNRGNARFAQRDYERAISDFNAALGLAPGYALAYRNRGSAWYYKGDYEKALADFDAAVRLDPKDADAFNNRGRTWAAKLDFARAIADYDAALRLDPKHRYAARNRGMARYFAGNFAPAAKDFEQARDTAADAYDPLWLSLAAQRAAPKARHNPPEPLDDDPAWPRPLFDFFRGKLGEAQLIEAADQVPPSGDAQRKPLQQCEAAYYLGQWHLAHNERNPGVALMRRARELCPRTFVEYTGAAAELKRLGF